MDDHTQAKLNAFRSLVQKSGALHADLATLDTAIRDLDAIKERITVCRDEMEAHRLLAELRRAEETVTVKRLRESRLRDELTVAVKEAEIIYMDAVPGIERLIKDAEQVGLQALSDLLCFLQPEEENYKRDEANKVVLAAFAASVLAEDLRLMLRNAYHSIGVATKDPYGPAKGVRTALDITDALLARIPELRHMGKRHIAASEAFRKALGTKG